MSICTSCGRQRDSCDICGGDLADAGVYCNARKAERDALAAEVERLREALESIRCKGENVTRIALDALTRSPGGDHE